MSYSAIDHAHMARALRLAERGLYTTQPNPRVGCVIAQGERVVGEGWHERAGEPHAEVFALRAAGDRVRGGTAYVTLEPCAHFGRTPPCADALIAAGIARVVAACEDPNPKVAGGGFAKARAAGIMVETGLMREAARELNRGFFSRIERGRPWVRIKLAMSLDGRTALANGASKWITSEAARTDVQRWRARSSAIMTGSGTVLADNPRLTVRRSSASVSEEQTYDSVSPDNVGGDGWGDGAAPGGTSRQSKRRRLTQPSAPSKLEAEGFESLLAEQTQGSLSSNNHVREGFKPLRVVLDRALRIARGANVLDGSVSTLVFHAAGSTMPDDRYRAAHTAAIAIDIDGQLDLEAALRELAASGVNELQVEAGPTLCGALFARGLVDELLLYIAPVMLGDQAQPLLKLPGLDAMTQAQRLRVVDQRQIGADWRLLLRR